VILSTAPAADWSRPGAARVDRRHERTAVARRIVRDGGNPVGEPGSVLFRREHFDAAGGFDGRLRFPMDLDLWPAAASTTATSTAWPTASPPSASGPARCPERPVGPSMSSNARTPAASAAFRPVTGR